MQSPRMAERWILIALAGVCAGSLAAWLAPLGWPFELFSHFRPQLAAAAALLAAALLASRARRAALLAGALAAVHLAAGPGRLLADEPAPSCVGPALVVVTANVEFGNADRERFLSWLALHPADIVVVQEVTAQWAKVLAAQREYPYQRVVTREDPYGIAILSRWPFESLASADLAGDGVLSFEGIARVRGETIHVLGLHTRWPVTPALLRARDRALLGAAVRVRAQPMTTVLAGDLNLAPDAPAYARLLADSGLRDVFAGRGWYPTWMAGFWPLALRIDYALVSPQLCVEHAEVGPEIGSDHRPVIARLRFGSAPSRRG